MSDRIELEARVPDDLGGDRLDQVAAQLFPDYSRSRLQLDQERRINGGRAAAQTSG